MKFSGGRTIMNGKNGDIAYESMADIEHLVGSSRPETSEQRVKAVKFEERFRGPKKVPAKTIMDLKELGDFKPFSHKNGLPKYSIYDFKKSKILKLRNKNIELVKKLLKETSDIGLTLAFRKFNTQRNLVDKLKSLEHQNKEVLNKYWKRSFEKFMNPRSH